MSKYRTIFEVSVLFDGHMGKMFPLSLEIYALGLSMNIIILVIGSLVHVHNRFIPGLFKNDKNKSEAKYGS